MFKNGPSDLDHAHLTYPTFIWRLRRGDAVGISPRFLTSENQSSWAIVWRCLRDLRLAVGTVPDVIDGDGRTDGQTTTGYTALA